MLPALEGVARRAGLDWEALGAALRREGRWHLGTYCATWRPGGKIYDQTSLWRLL